MIDECTIEIDANSPLWQANSSSQLTFYKPDPDVLFQLNSISGRTLMTIKPDGTVTVDELQPATETAKQVLDLLVRWMPYYMRNNNPLEGELIEDEFSHK